jgi:DUF761-associated sequence motif
LNSDKKSSSSYQRSANSGTSVNTKKENHLLENTSNSNFKNFNDNNPARGKSEHGKLRIPSVIARLMGLEDLPEPVKLKVEIMLRPSKKEKWKITLRGLVKKENDVSAYQVEVKEAYLSYCYVICFPNLKILHLEMISWYFTDWIANRKENAWAILLKLQVFHICTQNQNLPPHYSSPQPPKACHIKSNSSISIFFTKCKSWQLPNKILPESPTKHRWKNNESDTNSNFIVDFLPCQLKVSLICKILEARSNEYFILCQ